MSVNSATPQARILVVDDEPHIVEYLQMGFEYEGFAVSVAYDGEEALQVARQAPHDIAILDVMLGEMSGVEVARRLRASDEMGIIMLTARSSTAERIAGLDLGADDYVTKPFEFKELVARVRAVLRRRGKSANHVLTFDDLTLDRDAHWVTRGERVIDLTPREFELLALFVAPLSLPQPLTAMAAAPRNAVHAIARRCLLGRLADTQFSFRRVRRDVRR